MQKQGLGVIIGASRGFGKAVAYSLASAWSHVDAKLVLVSRNMSDLSKVEKEIKQQKRSIDVKLYAADVSNAHEVEQLMGFLSELRSQRTHSILIQNAGSLGPLGQAHDWKDYISLQRAVELNVTSFYWLCANWQRLWLTDIANSNSQRHNSTIVNVSSLAAIQPMNGLAIYSSMKAARNQLLATMALDEKTRIASSDAIRATFKYLNYAPGPMKTNMLENIFNSPELSDRTKQHFQDLWTHPGQLVDENKSAARLVQLLIENKFQSGDHIDYYDLE